MTDKSAWRIIHRRSEDHGARIDRMTTAQVVPRAGTGSHGVLLAPAEERDRRLRRFRGAAPLEAWQLSPMRDSVESST